MQGKTVNHALSPAATELTPHILEFLQGLAARLGLTALVYVPAARDRVVQLSGTADRLPDLRRVGERRLAEPQAASADADHLSFVPVHDTGGEVTGVVVAEHSPRGNWSERDEAVLAFCVGSVAGQFDDPALTLTEELRTAIGNEELSLLYQPEYDLLTGQVIAAEALVRWQHPTRGELQPADFIELAEQSGLIKPIGDWVIDSAVRTLGQWRLVVPQLRFRMRVNVSPVQMTDTDMLERVARALDEFDVPGSLVSIELTERETPRDLREVARVVRGLKELGVTSAIDDLATGYSTLSQLRALPVDMIKIDRSLVTGIDEDPRAQSIVTAMIGLALNFGLEVVAEGVQNEREVATLLALGCTRAQGHFLSRPLTADALFELVHTERPVSLE